MYLAFVLVTLCYISCRFLRNAHAVLQKHTCDLEIEHAPHHAATLFGCIKQDYSWKYVAKLHHRQESQKTFSVPFTCAYDLVASRRVCLSRGTASVPYGLLSSVLTQCNEDLLKGGLAKVSEKMSGLDDIRIQRLSRKLKVCVHDEGVEFDTGQLPVILLLGHVSESESGIILKSASEFTSFNTTLTDFAIKKWKVKIVVI